MTLQFRDRCDAALRCHRNCAKISRSCVWTEVLSGIVWKKLLVFTKLVDSNFRAFWLAPVTRNILGYSLFWDGTQNGFSFRDSFERWDFSGKWSSCTNKHQERDKIWCLLVGRGKFSRWVCNKIIKNDPRNTINWNVNKLSQRDVFYFQKVYFWFLSNWLGNYWNNYPPQGRFVVLDIYLDALRPGVSTTIHLPFGGWLYNISSE